MITLIKTVDGLVGPTGRPASWIPFREYVQGTRGRSRWSVVHANATCADCGRIISSGGDITNLSSGSGVVCSTAGRRGRQTYCAGCVEVQMNLIVAMDAPNTRNLLATSCTQDYMDAQDALTLYRWDTLYLGYALAGDRSGSDLLDWMLLGGHLMPKQIVLVTNNQVARVEMQAKVDALYERERERAIAVPVTPPITETTIASVARDTGAIYVVGTERYRRNPSVQHWDSVTDTATPVDTSPLRIGDERLNGMIVTSSATRAQQFWESGYVYRDGGGGMYAWTGDRWIAMPTPYDEDITWNSSQ